MKKELKSDNDEQYYISPYPQVSKSKNRGDINLLAIAKNPQVSFQPIGKSQKYHEILLKNDGEKIHDSLKLGYSSEIMTRLTLTILEKAVFMAKDSGYTGKLSLNIGEPEMRSRIFGEQILKILHFYQFSPEKLDLEILETVPLKNLNNSLVRDNMSHLFQKGISFALDDIDARPSFEHNALIDLFQTDSLARNCVKKIKFEIPFPETSEIQFLQSYFLGQLRGVVVLEKGTTNDFQRVSAEMRKRSAFLSGIDKERRGVLEEQNFENGGKVDCLPASISLFDRH